MIVIDFDKAKEVTKARLRAERAPLLASLDVQFQRALETGSDTSEIVAEKNRLRDITNLVDAATTLEELKAINCDKPVEAPVVEEPIVEAPVVEQAAEPVEQPAEGGV